MADEDAKKVLDLYRQKFDRLPGQPHHLIAFSKSRSDLPTLNYRNAKGAMDDAKKQQNAFKLDPQNMAQNDMQIAQAKSLPSSPKSVQIQKQKQQKIMPKDEGDNGEGLLSEDEDDEDDALYNDGNETTAPGFVAQMAMEANAIANDEQFDYVTPIAPVYADHEDDNQSAIPDDNQSIASANPLNGVHKNKNKFHSNRQVNAMLAQQAANAPIKIQSLRDWCFDNGLTDIYDKLISSGYNTCKILSKCRDDQIEKISQDLGFTTPQELTFKVAVEELRVQYLEHNYQLRHPEEHRSLTDMTNKIKEAEKLMTNFYGKMQSMHNEIYAYQMDVEREFQTIAEQLNKRKMVLLNDLNKFFTKKKSIITMKQQTLTVFITETKSQKNNVISMLQDGNIDYTKIEKRKQKIMQIHDEVIVKFVNVKKVEYSGFPKVNTSFPTTHNLLTEISRFGKITENIQNTLGVMPVITIINHSGKGTIIKIKWELTNDHYGIDPDTVKSIRIEWIEVDEEDLQSELEDSIAAMFGPDGGMVSRKTPQQIVSNQAYTQNLGNMVDIPGGHGHGVDSKQSEQKYNDNNNNNMNGMVVPVHNAGYINKMESNLMNFAVIQPLNTEIEEEKKNNVKVFQQHNKKKKMTLNRWMSKHLDFSLYKRINNEHEVNVRKYGKFLVRIKLLGSEQALTTNYVQSNVFSIRVQKMNVDYVKDKWDPRTKHKDLKIGLVNKKILTRAVPGKWRNCFGTVAVSQGLNIWKILLKKMDSNRKAFSCMIGVMDANKVGYMDTNFIEVGGYGMYMNNGHIFHNKKNGMKYYDHNSKKGLRAPKQGDVISVIVDYYRGTLSFKINQYDCGPAWSNINKFVNYKLCISLRGCDEVKILDADNANNNNKMDEKYSKIGANIARKQKFVNKNNKKAKRKKPTIDLSLDIAVAQDLSLDSAGINLLAKTAGSKSVGSRPYVHNENIYNSSYKNKNKNKYKISAKNIRNNASVIRKKSQDIFDKIRRSSANSSQIKNDVDDMKEDSIDNVDKIDIKKLKNVEKTSNKMKKKSKHYKQSRSFNFMKKSKDKKEIERKKKALKNLNDESSESREISLSTKLESLMDEHDFDISQLTAIDDENSIIPPSEMSYNAVANEPNVLL